jgi:hypothetical protein
LVLSHVPIENINGSFLGAANRSSSYSPVSTRSKEEFAVRAESQKEINTLVETCFKHKLILNVEDFNHVIEYIDSGMYLCLLSLLRVHLPSLSEFQKYNSTQKSKGAAVKSQGGRKLAISKVLCSFAPVSGLTRSSSSESIVASKSKELKKELPKSKFGKTLDVKKSCIASGVRLTNQKVPLTPTTPTEVKPETTTEQLLFCQCGRQLTDFDTLRCESCKQADCAQRFEGYLYTPTEKPNNFEKKWYAVDKKVFYCYKAKTDTTYMKMRSLIGCFIKEECAGRIGNKTIGYPFTLAFTNSIVKKYYAKSKEECTKWCEIIRETIGCSNIKDYYEFKVITLLEYRILLEKVNLELLRLAFTRKPMIKLLLRSLRRVL